MAPLFKRSSVFGWRFWFFMILSFLLYFLDRNGNTYIQQCRYTLSIPVQSLQFFVNRPFELMHQFGENFSAQEGLIAENQRLRTQKATLLVQFQQWDALAQENKKLHQLLNTQSQIDGKILGAQIIRVNGWSGNQTVVVDKGSADHVFVGQIVLDAQGFFGEVIRVNRSDSIILLLTDLKSAIPVEVVRTGERGIVAGTGELDTLTLNNLTKTADLKQGDQLVTSHLGGNLPAGYPVGTVRSVHRDSAEMFAQVEVSPVAHVQQETMVFLVWPNPEPHSLIAPVPAGITS